MENRSKAVIRRTYARPKNEAETEYESWEEICERVNQHQRWLWIRAKGKPLTIEENKELATLKELMINKTVLTSGRTLWLGGTDVAKKREASQFNCAFIEVETVYDVVDVLWNLMQGCGIGFKPIFGTLNGFSKYIPEIEVKRTTRTKKGGLEHNVESYDEKTRTWTIQVGDSAEAWSKSIGKLLVGKKNANKLVFDFSQLRPAGERLKGYGWISSGDESLAIAYLAIAELLNKRAGELLSKIDILDLINWLGTILSSRRSAQIALFEYNKQEWKTFSSAKKNYWHCTNCDSQNTTGIYCNDCKTNSVNIQRIQSNNSLTFNKQPTKDELTEIFTIMKNSGGSEPGFINLKAAKKKAPWVKGVNPCAEILLGNKTFCNLVEINIAKFKGNNAAMFEAIRIAARANYRQTCVDLRDEILQESWHLNNEFLRLCGVGLTGIVQRNDLIPYDIDRMKTSAICAANSMADELNLQRPRNVTTVKPSGTLSKVMKTTEGIHKPLGKFMINNINFGKNDPLLPMLAKAGYKIFDNPNMPTEGTIVSFPIKWDNIEFDKFTKEDGTVIEINTESAVTQLNRYKKWQTFWCQQNVSNTISYSPEEVPAIIEWLHNNWDKYIGVSFIYRIDPTKSAKDLGYLYLPQEVITEETYTEYVSKLSSINMDELNDTADNEIENQECSGGACPVK